VSCKRILYAPNIHQGGGKTLLLLLLQELMHASDMIFILDERMLLPDACELEGMVCRVPPTLLSRLQAEWHLRQLVKESTVLLCMGSVPPLLAHKGEQLVFLQNRYLIERRSVCSFPWRVRARLQLERWWLVSRAKYVKKFIVQTPTMKSLLKEMLGVEAMVSPFVSLSNLYAEPRMEDRDDFIYVASGEPHKNHRMLIESWVNLAQKGFFPRLCLTLDPCSCAGLLAVIDVKKKQYNLRVDNLGCLSTDELKQQYLQSGTLIYPSLLESFGLPLIEAKSAGLKVVASELDYVRDILDPDETFNPYSSVSIAKAVARLMRYEDSVVQLVSAEAFLQSAFEAPASKKKEK